MLLNCLKLFFRASVVHRTPGSAETNLQQAPVNGLAGEERHSVVRLRKGNPALTALYDRLNTGHFEDQPGYRGLFAFTSIPETSGPAVFLVDGRYAFQATEFDIVYNGPNPYYTAWLLGYEENIRNPRRLDRWVGKILEGSYQKLCINDKMYLIWPFSYENDSGNIRYNAFP